MVAPLAFSPEELMEERIKKERGGGPESAKRTIFAEEMLTTEGSTRSTTEVNPEVNDTWSLTAALAMDNKILTPCELRRPVIHNPATPPIPRASSRIIAAIGRRTSIHPLFFVGVVSFIPPPVSAPPARPRRWAVLGQRPLPCGRLPKRSPQDRFL